MSTFDGFRWYDRAGFMSGATEVAFVAAVVVVEIAWLAVLGAGLWRVAGFMLRWAIS